MKLFRQKLILILLLCFTTNSFTQNCINTFESGNSTNNYLLNGFTNTLETTFYWPCSNSPDDANISNNIWLNDLNANATLVSNADETHLADDLGINISRVFEGNRALKLNPTNFGSSDKTTIRTTSITITEDILSFRYLHIGHVQGLTSDHPDAYFQYRLLNANNQSVIDSQCFKIDDAYNECRYTSQETSPGYLVVYTPDWINQEINVSQLNFNSQVILEFTVSDCGTINETGDNHFSTAYIDNICQYNESLNEGELEINRFNTLNCPEDSFTVSGTYNTSDCSNEPTIITVKMAPSNDLDPTSTVGEEVIAQAIFTDGNYSFDIDSNAINFDESQDYNIYVCAEFADGSVVTEFLKGIEITFDDCEETQCQLVTGVQYEWVQEDPPSPILTWDSIAGATYTLEFVVDNALCGYGPQPLIDGNSATFTTNKNFIYLNTVHYEIGGFYWRYRIRTGPNCEWTEWSCTDTALARNAKHTREINGKNINLESISTNLQLHPNPAKDELSISMDNTKLAVVELYDIYGARVLAIKKSSNALKHKINVESLRRGYYVVKVRLEDGTIKFKNIILK